MTDPQPGYRLAHEPDGTSYTVRENLVDILERELLGPAGGPEELLPVSPRQVYLVGHIAPVKLAEGHADPEHAEDGYGMAGIRGTWRAGRTRSPWRTWPPSRPAAARRAARHRT